MDIEQSVFESLDNVCEASECVMCDGTGFKDHAGFCMDPCNHYPAELAELSDESQAEDLIDKTDVADGFGGEDSELLARVTDAVKKWRASH